MYSGPNPPPAKAAPTPVAAPPILIPQNILDANNVSEATKSVSVSTTQS